MPAKDKLDVPAAMEKVYRRLERWRKTRHGRSPIPKWLWAAAAAVAREHGLNRTSAVLHLECNVPRWSALKRVRYLRFSVNECLNVREKVASRNLRMLAAYRIR